MRLSDQEHHRLLLLKHLRANEPIARTDLVALTGLTGGTITAITADLLRRGLVIEEKVTAKVPGRPRVNLRINPADKFVVGSTLTADSGFVVEIVNLRGESLSQTTSPLSATTNLEDLARQCAQAVARAIDSSDFERGAIYRIGIGLPAVVDNLRGVVEHMVTFDPGPSNFADIVQSEIGIPTLIDNNTNLLARAEHWFGDGACADDFTLITIDLGVGAALYRGGQLTTGANGIESEFGHVKVVPDTGRSCVCGGRGCLQTYCSISGIVEQYCQARGEPVPGYLDLRVKFEELVARLASGNAMTERIFERAGHYLGIGVANHITMQDPQTIVILTPHVEQLEIMRDSFSKSLERNVFPSLQRRTQIHFKDHDQSIFARGAAAMVLEKIYSAS
jgi:predicted NBD/HSP70 family sugar kinase/translation initiation factor IF-1